MKKNIKYSRAVLLSIIFVMVVLSFAGCSKTQRKNKTITEFETFVNHISKNKSNYNSSEWDIADTTFNQYCRKFDGEYKDVLTDEDYSKINKLKGRYYAYKNVNAAQDFIKEIAKGVNEIKDKAEGFVDGVREALTDSSKSIKP